MDSYCCRPSLPWPADRPHPPAQSHHLFVCITDIFAYLSILSFPPLLLFYWQAISRGGGVGGWGPSVDCNRRYINRNEPTCFFFLSFYWLNSCTDFGWERIYESAFPLLHICLWLIGIVYAFIIVHVNKIKWGFSALAVAADCCCSLHFFALPNTSQNAHEVKIADSKHHPHHPSETSRARSPWCLLVTVALTRDCDTSTG